MNKIIEFLKGKKTYIIGIAGIIYGLYSGSHEMVLTGFGLMGLRNGISTEITKLLEY